MTNTDSAGKNECCGDHLDAARAGHTQCLQGLSEAGRFLPLGSPDRASAGELRRLEVWQAAITTCRAGHRPTLSWLFASGWPSSIDAALTWQTRDTVDLHQLMERRSLVGKDQLISEVTQECLDSEEPLLLELDLYRYAMREATPECLEALLEAGCRSEWICRLAALEGNAAFLTLAADRGCPCDLITLKLAARSGDILLLMAAHSAALLSSEDLGSGVGGLGEASCKHISQAADLAASEGHAECLEALLGWFGKSAVSDKLAASIASRGDLNCLQTLHRAGCLDVEAAADGAAEGAQLECLQYLLDLEPRLVNRPLLTSAAYTKEAKPEAQLACLEFLQRCGCQWSPGGREIVASTGSPEVLRYCLQRVRVRPWDEAMLSAIFRSNSECMQVLYDAGYEQHRSRDPSLHPAVIVNKWGMGLSRTTAKACFSLAVNRSGLPDVQLLDSAAAAQWGEDLLRYVHGLGVPFSIGFGCTTNTAAGTGNVGALRYALQSGAPWDAGTFECAIAGSCHPDPSRFDADMGPGCLECLKCLHEFARAAGFPEKSWRPSKGAFASHFWPYTPGPTLEVLQYVCDHMGPTWAAPLLVVTAQILTGWALGGRRGRHEVKWEVVLYLGRKLKHGLPAPLGEMVAARRERAAALAGVFFKAGRLAQGRGHPQFLALWGAMAGLPSDLRERIASQAHLIYCEAAAHLHPS
eukprot:jgi/Botrbrau1/12749/Bobra.67_1s0108.1